MSSAYLSFLNTLGVGVGADIDTASDARIEPTPPLLELVDRNVITPLPFWSVLQVQGPDAGKFLQGQLTCDINTATPAQAVPGAHCSPKGRMRSSFLVVARGGDGYWLRVRSDVAAVAAAALGKYIVFSKAAIAPQEQLLALGLSGPGAAEAIAACAGSVPGELNAVVQTPGGLIVQRDAAGRRFEAFVPSAEATALWRAADGFLPVSSTFWRWQDIRAGFASVSGATVEAFIPQMLNYDGIGAISFSKGCYTGQEIVARAHYRGQVKRHLLRAEVAAPPAAPGTDIVDANGRAVGEIVEAVARGDGFSELLAVVGGDQHAPGDLRLILTESLVPGGSAALRVL